ncbi:MAG TPA: hypothetical protein VLE53_04720 [Gemmatimonadaceae bacterium]|nr:hypothetical protein [Gemmatimonadaceae bacterium]
MRKLWMAGLALSLLACDDDDDDPAGPDTSFAGTYAMISIASQPLPATLFQDATSQIQVTSGQLVLTAANEWTGSVTVVTTTNGVPLTETLDAGGSFTISGSVITFTDESDQSTFTGTLNGDQITANLEVLEGTTAPVVFER